MGQGLANKRLAQPLSKPEAMLRSFSRWWKKTSQSWKKNNHRVKKQISTKFAIWVQKCKFHKCTSFSTMQMFGKFSKQCLLKDICWLLCWYLTSSHLNYTLQLWHHIKLFSNREYVFQVVDQSCIHYGKFVAITAFGFWHWDANVVQIWFFILLMFLLFWGHSHLQDQGKLLLSENLSQK